MKNITLLTNVGASLAVLNAALGIREAETPRMSEGSFIASILREYPTPVSLAITHNTVAVVEDSALGFSGLEMLFSFTGGGTPIDFEAQESPLKTKALLVDGFVASNDYTWNSAPVTDPFLLGVMVPAAPSYTLLSLINKLFAIAESEGIGILVLVDQETESVRLIQYANEAAANAQLAGAAAAISGDSKTGAVFSLVDPAVNDPEASTRDGWE